MERQFHMKITEEEKQIIIANREKSKLITEAKKTRNELLFYVEDYLHWLTENNRGSSFSTFIDEYQYSGQYKSSLVYQLITKRLELDVIFEDKMDEIIEAISIMNS